MSAQPEYVNTYSFKALLRTWNYSSSDRGLEVEERGRKTFVPWDQVRGAGVGLVNQGLATDAELKQQAQQAQTAAGAAASTTTTAQLLVSVQQPGGAKPKLKRFGFTHGDPEAMRMADELARRLGPRWQGVDLLNPMTRKLGYSTAWAAVVVVLVIAAVLAAILFFALRS